MIRKTNLKTECCKISNEGIFHLLKVQYDKYYMGQVMIENPKKDIPKIIRTLESALREYKRLERLGN